LTRLSQPIAFGGRVLIEPTAQREALVVIPQARIQSKLTGEIVRFFDQFGRYNRVIPVLSPGLEASLLSDRRVLSNDHDSQH
jgi:hypothetical protein